MSNGAPELVDGPLGTPLLSHVEGRSVRALLEALFEDVRERKGPVEVGYRCDAPDRRRFMRMRIEPGEDAEILVRSWIVREEPREPVRLFDRRVERSVEMLRACAWCRRILVEGEWLPAEDAVDRLELFERETVPDITHTICPTCREDVETAVRPAAG